MTKEWLTQGEIDEHIRRRVAAQLSADIAGTGQARPQSFLAALDLAAAMSRA